MVLQRGPQKAIIWGTADTVGERVTVTIHGHGHVTTHVTKHPSKSGGIWKVKLPAITAHGPFTVLAKSSEGEATLHDVLFGDVWVCSGQSNMEFSMYNIFNASAEMATASSFKNIRIFKAKKSQSPTPYQDLSSIAIQWSLPTKRSLPNFSAVCMLYAEYLYPHLNYPIGLVDTDWGGTPIEAWSSPEALNACSHIHKRGPFVHTVLWNAMVSPLLPMTIYGAIWYQGESNAHVEAEANRYACKFPEMINDWRKRFNEASLGETRADFPFGFVQLAANSDNLANFGAFPALRWAQTAKYGFVPNKIMPNTFMSVAMDLPDPHAPYGTIHPRDKQDVARRLVLSGLSVAYGIKGIDSQGPFPTAFTAHKVHHTLHIEYDNGNIPIDVRNNTGFEVCCSAQSIPCGDHDPWVAAPVTKHDTTSVTLTTSACHQHVFGVRYAWRATPCEFKKCSVYGRDNDLPAPPFKEVAAF
ncbi:sialate O-acetylesterase-like [Gigantopelta aegis]|uniref:sialate O-acetylesterase-like n=1 Tax=Gigantopelta aegis TaxID=1735272 RepID=UPI001B887880|nr:sialate O-acetylesterase-like [Gigantopelta aegis]